MSQAASVRAAIAATRRVLMYIVVLGIERGREAMPIAIIFKPLRAVNFYLR